MKKGILTLGTSFGHVVSTENHARRLLVLNDRSICQAFNSPFRRQNHNQHLFLSTDQQLRSNTATALEANEYRITKYHQQLIQGRACTLSPFRGETLTNGLANGHRIRSFSSQSKDGKSEKKKTKVIDNRKSPKIDLKVIYHESTSKYEGEPLIKPKIPYQYNVKTF